MNQPAQTINYMIAGYVVIFGSLIGYIISLVTRWRKLNEEKKILTEENN
jgi:hypothetical protein